MSYVSTDIKKIIAEIIENKKEKGGVKNIYFVGCGGSLGALYPAKTFMEREAQVLRSAWINSNEFVHSTPKDFGENSIICLACHKGNTPETIQAAKLGKEKGAAVIILTWLEESEIIEFGDYIIRYTFDASLDHLAGDIDYAGEKTQCALLVAVELLAQTEGYENYEKFYEGLGMISNIIKNARKHVAERAEAFAEEYKNDSVIYTMGSGASYGAAYMESICIFMEMQWLDSSSMQIICDMIGRQICIPKRYQCSAYGDAAMAALGDRRFRDFTELRDSLPKGKILVPNEKNHIYYKEHYKMFRDLYLNNKDMMHRI